jgi:hypothetical protein
MLGDVGVMGGFHAVGEGAEVVVEETGVDVGVIAAEAWPSIRWTAHAKSGGVQPTGVTS